MPKTKQFEIEQYENNIRAVIKKNMEANGYRTHRSLARKLNISESSFSLRIKNPGTFRLDEIHRMTKILNIPKEEIWMFIQLSN